jgi:hypothetical protein
MCTPSTEVRGGCRFGGELMTDNSENSRAAALLHARRSSGQSIPRPRRRPQLTNREGLAQLRGYGARPTARAESPLAARR